MGTLWAELLQDVMWGHAAFPEPTALSAAPSHRDASPSLPSPGWGPSFFLLLLKAHVHLGSRGFRSPCGHSPSPGKGGAPSERDPPGKAHPVGTRAHPSTHRVSRFCSPSKLCAPRRWMRLLWRCLCGRRAASGAGPRAAWRGAGGQMLSSMNSHPSSPACLQGHIRLGWPPKPSLQGWSDRGLCCVHFLSKEKAGGMASGRGW